jgi:hypothetical protein
VTEVAPHSNPSKLRGLGRSALRIALAVVGIVALALVVLLGLNWSKYRHANGPNPKVDATIVGSAAEHLVLRGFAGCPTVQQVLDLSEEPERRELRRITNGIDPWGMPFQIRCDLDRVHAFSMGPDRQPGTQDDIHASR